MLVVGLTGSIGSGKTTVANMFANLKAPIIDADIIAKDLTQPHTKAFHQIVEHFSHSIVSNGTLDRKKLRQIIFDNPKEKKWLENLLHPFVIETIQQQLKNMTSVPYCIVIIPLLIETGPYPFIERILIVETDEELQLVRLQQRDQSHIEDLRKILNSQATTEERRQHAHDIILNHGDLNDLRVQVEKLHTIYSALDNNS
ncbi:MAG TPA: dephospho-CoA kinase [Gammaproteobacteria bacterium]|nr:dephospho-CoA kinase [Gammaproteobacteria bacterium]